MEYGLNVGPPIIAKFKSIGEEDKISFVAFSCQVVTSSHPTWEKRIKFPSGRELLLFSCM